MKTPLRIFSIVALLIMIGLCSYAQNKGTSAQGNKLNKHLLWADEFDYTGLPDSTIWDYEIGYIRNKEAQYYTLKRLENARVENGTLILESRKEDFEGFKYTSASINTLDKKSFDGNFRVEISARLPQGKGIWPAIWMMGVNRKTIGWPKCSELDIMEFVGHTPNTVYATMHWADSTIGYNYKSKGDKAILTTLHDTFHLYVLERKDDQIQVFVDDQCILTFQVPATAYPGSFTTPLYLLLNTAIGGSWGGDIDDSIFPQQFIIDFVRVYNLGMK